MTEILLKVALKHHNTNTVLVFIFLCEVRQLGFPVDKKKKNENDNPTNVYVLFALNLFLISKIVFIFPYVLS